MSFGRQKFWHYFISVKGKEIMHRERKRKKEERKREGEGGRE